MMKKVLAFALTGAMVLSSFSMAFADETKPAANPVPTGKVGASLSDVAASPNKEAIEVVNDLGIVVGTPEGTFLPTKDVTRAEYAAMITRALAIPNSALDGYGKVPFKDIDGYQWANGYLAFCNSKGIMLGDGAGNAMPGRTITTNEAVTMALRAIGYTDNSSELKGFWPSNYVTKAQELNLYDKVAKQNVGATRENAAQIIYNLLDEQKVAVNTDGKTERLWDQYPTVAASGVAVKGIPTTLFSAGLNCRALAAAVITNDNLTESSINLAKYLGMYGTKYESRDTKKIVAFKPADNSQMLVGRFTKNGDEFVTTDENTYTVKKNDAAYTIVSTTNGKQTEDKATLAALSGDNKMATIAAAPANVGKEVEVYAEISGKTIKNVFSVNRWTMYSAAKAAKSDLADIKDKKLSGYKFAENDNKELDVNQFQLIGVNALADIKEDNVLYVYPDADKKVRRIEVGTKTVEGTVKSFKNGGKADGTAAIFKIGDVMYKNADAANDNFLGVLDFANASAPSKQIKDADVSKEVKVLLDGRGFVYEVTKTSRANNIAVVKTQATTLDAQARLVLADGSEKVFTYDKGDIIEEDKTLLPLPAAENTLTEGTVIGYGVNKNGEITSANLAFYGIKSMKLKSKSLISDIVTGGTKVGVQLNGAAMTAPASSVKVADNAVVFTKDGSKYAVTTIDKVKLDTVIGGNNDDVVLLFDEDSAGKTDMKTVVGMIIPKSFAKGGDEKYAVVNSVKFTTAADDSSTRVQEVELIIDGKAETKLTDSDNTFTGPYATYHSDMVGHDADVKLFKITLDAKGIITSAKPVNNSDPDEEATVTGKVGTAKAHEVKFFKAKDDTSRQSVEVEDNKRVALSSKVVIYRLEDDGKYSAFGGDLKKGDIVKLYEVNDEIGYDVVIFVRPETNANAPVVPPVVTPQAVAYTSQETKEVFEDEVDAKTIIVKLDSADVKWTTVTDLKSKVVLSGANARGYVVDNAVGAGNTVTITLNNMIKAEDMDIKVALNIKDVEMNGNKKVQDNIAAAAVINKVKHVVNVTEAKGGAADAGAANKVKLMLAEAVTGITSATFKVESGTSISTISNNPVLSVSNETTTTVELTVTNNIESTHHFKVTVSLDNAMMGGKPVKFKLAPSLGNVEAH